MRGAPVARQPAALPPGVRARTMAPSAAELRLSALSVKPDSALKLAAPCGATPDTSDEQQRACRHSRGSALRRLVYPGYVRLLATTQQHIDTHLQRNAHCAGFAVWARAGASDVTTSAAAP